MSITNAIFNKLVTEGKIAEIEEVWAANGLDSDNALNTTTAQMTVGDITLNLTGDNQNIVVTSRE